MKKWNRNTRTIRIRLTEAFSFRFLGRNYSRSKKKNRNLRQRASFVRGRARASSIRREQKAKGKSYFFSKLPVDYWLASDHRPRSFSSLQFLPVPTTASPSRWLDGTFMTYKFPRFCCGSLHNIVGICCSYTEKGKSKRNRIDSPWSAEQGEFLVKMTYLSFYWRRHFENKLYISEIFLRSHS